MKTVSSWSVTSCQRHRVSLRTNHKVKILLCQFQTQLTKLYIRSCFTVLETSKSTAATTKSKQSIASMYQYLHFTQLQLTYFHTNSSRTVLRPRYKNQNTSKSQIHTMYTMYTMYTICLLTSFTSSCKCFESYLYSVGS